MFHMFSSTLPNNIFRWIRSIVLMIGRKALIPLGHGYKAANMFQLSCYLLYIYMYENFCGKKLLYLLANIRIHRQQTQ